MTLGEPLWWPHGLPFHLHRGCDQCLRQGALEAMPVVRKFRLSQEFNPVEELWLDYYEAGLCRLAGVPRCLTRKRVRA